jgi:hypothetical protein
MPKIRDLGISVIPATMRPPQIGYGAAGPDDACIPTDPGHPCNPTDPQCVPSSPPQCDATPGDQCCPTDQPHSAKDRDGGGISPDTRRALMQQLREQISTGL